MNTKRKAYTIEELKELFKKEYERLDEKEERAASVHAWHYAQDFYNRKIELLSFSYDVLGFDFLGDEE